MKFIKKTLILLCSALVLCLSLAIAACGDDGKRTLSFETYGGTEIAPIEAEAGEDISEKLPADPAKKDNFFGGWYLDDSFTEKATLPTVMPDKDVTYYAKWTPTAGAAAYLTLQPGNGGVLHSTRMNVAVGANLLEFLATCEQPTPNEGLTFAGWYKGDTPLGAADVMPASGLTLTAKYNAKYTVEVYRQGTDGNYAKDAQDITGTAFYGEPFSCTDIVETPEHFTVSAGEDGYIASDALGAGETFKVYLARERYYITYDPNAPKDTPVSGTTSLQTVLYGAKAVISACGYRIDGQTPYRFAGWAESSDSTVKYTAGQTAEISASTILYAVWEKGYTDVFGGQDVLYPDRFTEGVLRLGREGIEEKVGSYDTETNLFSFAEGEKQMLDGRLLPDAGKFFYFRDTLEGEYADLDGTNAKLAMNEGGAIVYTDAEGAQHTGKYSIDPDTGYFFFDDDAGETGDFYYNLFNAVDSDEVVFRRQSTEELGYYYDKEAGVVLYLDGLGGLRYYYNEKNAEYQDFSGKPIYIAIGYYEWRADDGLFLAYTRDIFTTLKQFTFKTTKQENVKPAESYPDLPSSAAIKGIADLDDEMRGSYNAKREDSENELYLDGYGHGTFGGEEGTYEPFTWLYSYEEEDGEVTDLYRLVRFTPEDGDDIIYFRLDTAYGDYEFDRTISAEDIAAHEGYDFGRYDFTNLFVLNITFDGFIMIFENGGAEVWTQYGITTQGNIVYVLYLELVSTVVKDESGVYTFRDTASTTGQSNGNEFRFTIDSAKKTMNVVLPEEHDVAQVATGLTLDYTERKATYNGKVIDYWYTIGFIDFYTFEIDEDTLRNFWTVSGEHKDFREVSDNDIYDLYVQPGAEESYSARLMYTGETAQGGAQIVYLAYMLESGMYRFVGRGTVTENEESDDYHFHLNDRLTDMDRSDFDGFTDFDFCTYEGGLFRIRHTELRYSNFTSDGYGNYTFTDAAGQSHRGMIGEIIGEGDGMLIYFVEAGTATTYTLAVNERDNGSLVAVTSDVGYWYEMDDNQRISLYKYIVLNGQGSAFYYEINELTGEELPVVKGTYRRSSRYVGTEYQEPFPEYTITLNGETNNYLLATYRVQDNATGQELRLPLYQAQIAHRVGEFNVRGGGKIESVGYPGVLATYTDARGTTYEGNMYIGSAEGDIHDNSFVNDAEGSQVRFWVYTASGTATGTDFFFEIVRGELVPFTLPYGKYALSSADGLRATTVLTLDGRGTATLQRGSTRAITGTYSAIRGTEDYQFTSTSLSFRFRVSVLTGNDEQTYVYEQFDEESFLTLYDTSEWSVLTLDGYGGAECINRYGDRILGTYVLFAEGYGAFESDTFNTVFRYGDGAFEYIDHSAYLAAYYAADFSSVIFTDTRAILNGEEYFYTVENTTVHLYATGGTHAASTISLPTGKTYTYNNVAYTKYEGGELVFTDSEFNTTEPIELIFTPNGATFTATATFGGYEGYTVIVSYEKGAVKTTLTYRANTMDALPEEYAMQLHFAAEENTFTVTPMGGKDTYKQEIGSGSGATVNENNTIFLDTRRVGAYSIPLHCESAEDTLRITLGGIQDSKGNALTFTGSVALMQQDMDTHFSYGYSRVVRFTGADGVPYSMRFWLNEAKKQFLLHSVLVETVLEVENVGEVTFVQLWAAGTQYTGAKQKDLVAVSMRETGAETNIYSGSLGENKAALVRQNLNTTTGSYDYEAFVFDITYENGFVATATKEGDYGYGEAEQGSDYKVRFLFTGNDDTFEVAYLLTFSEGDRYVDATFEKEEGGWRVTSETTTYHVAIGRSSAGFTLTVTKN